LSGRPPTVLPLVRAAMVKHMRYHDRICFASVATIAREVGCCERSVQNAQRELERLGETEERPDLLPAGYRTRCWRFTFCTLRTSCRRTPGTLGSSRIFRNSGPGARRASAPRCGRRRKLMEEHPDVVSAGVQRASVR